MKVLEDALSKAVPADEQPDAVSQRTRVDDVLRHQRTTVVVLVVL